MNKTYQMLNFYQLINYIFYYKIEIMNMKYEYEYE